MAYPVKKRGNNPLGKTAPPKKSGRKLDGFSALDKSFMERRISLLLRTKVCDLATIAADDTKEAFDVYVSTMILKGIQEGCSKRFDVLLNRVVGRVVEKVEYVEPKPFVIESRSGEKTTLGVEKPQTIDVEVEVTAQEEGNESSTDIQDG